MKILVINSGSSSLKYQLLNTEDEKLLAEGIVEEIGQSNSCFTHKCPQKKVKKNLNIKDYKKAVMIMLQELTKPDYGVIKNMEEIEAVGHRVVHGGDKFKNSTLIDSEILKELEKLEDLAPLHNPPCIVGIKACQSVLPQVPMVAVFDTSYHQTMPEKAYIYGLNYDMFEKYNIRRYGFHGTSHHYVALRAAKFVDKPLDQLKIITCHLGNGSSVAAIKNGQVVDTSMGFTPLEGLVMGTRCGNIDPAIVPFIMEKEKMTEEEVTDYLNKKSGLLGLSGISSDMRVLEKAAQEGKKRAKLALTALNYSIIKYIGAYSAAMNGLDIIVFTGGIGENSQSTRKAVCESLTYLGLVFDAEKNDDRNLKEKAISKENSKIKALVIHTNEELMIARETKEVLDKSFQ